VRGQSVGRVGGKGIARPLYESLWACTFSGSFFCLKLDELYLERTWDRARRMKVVGCARASSGWASPSSPFKAAPAGWGPREQKAVYCRTMWPRIALSATYLFTVHITL